MQSRQIIAIVAFMALAAIAAADTNEPSSEVVSTPPQFHGPFYPSALPRDTDNDLVYINENDAPATGEVVHLSGRILDLNGEPVANAVVELWQSDANGIYLHHDSPHRSDYDRNFQGFGRVLTGPSGEYYFRTVHPATHIEKRSRRAPHFHLGVFVPNRSTLFTQIYFEGQVLNDRDPILNSVSDPAQRARLIVPMQLDETTGESQVTFDVVMRFHQQDAN